MKRNQRLILPLLLSCIVAYLMVGCIYIPATRQLMPNGKFRPEWLIGAAKSDKPIRLGVTSLEDAKQALSVQLSGELEPSGLFYGGGRMDPIWRSSADGKRYALQYDVDTGRWIWPLCFQITADTKSRYLILTVNDQHIVTGYESTDNLDVSYTPATQPIR